MGKYDEVNVVRVLNENPDIRVSNKVVEIKKDATNIGNSTHGKIDFLTKYCGWFFMWNNSAGTGGYVGNDDSKTNRELKKAKKEPKLTDKTKKGKKK